MKKIFFFFLLTSTKIFSQELPHGFSPEEISVLSSYKIPFHDFSKRSYSPFFSPPTSPVRTMAEWEESQGYLVTYTSYKTMVREIIRAGREQCRMYVVTGNTATTISDLLNAGIDTSNVTFLNAPYNTVWCRDYGQNPAYINKVDSLVFVDWIYNRPRPSDDTVPEGLARNMNVPVFHTTQAPFDLVNTGGNYMSDGMGTAFASNLILEDNSTAGGFGVNHTEAEIDTIMKNFMGITRYIKMETLMYDGIHHIDMHMKLLDEETIMVGEYPAGISDGPQIEANLQYILANYPTSFGTDWRVVRIPMPSDNGFYPNQFGDYLTYTNASFINKTIIVPTYNISTDTTALRIWRESCPGYKVVGINSTSSIPSSGALHCITHEIGVNDPLLINHARLRNTYNATLPYNVSAKAHHKSGIDSIVLYYTTDTTQPYQSVPMYDVFGDHYEGNIPAQSAGTEIFYYIRAKSVSGKEQVRPITAPSGFYNFHVLGTTDLKSEIRNPKSEVGRIFPNPSRGITCLPVTTSNTEKISIDCWNVLNEKIQNIFEGETKTGENHYFINTGNFTSGVYFIRYRIGETETTKRLVVK